MFALCGQIWVAKFEGVQTLLKNSVGLRYIHHLLQRPATPVHATQLVTLLGGVNADSVERVYFDEADALDEDNTVTDTLSNEGREHLLILLHDKKFELATVRGSATPARVEEMEVEIEQIEIYLAKHAHGTLAPKLPSRANRDRKSVTNAIERAVATIQTVHPSLVAQRVDLGGVTLLTKDAETATRLAAALRAETVQTIEINEFVRAIIVEMGNEDSIIFGFDNVSANDQRELLEAGAKCTGREELTSGHAAYMIVKPFVPPTPPSGPQPGQHA
jgi:hypothetical protein